MKKKYDKEYYTSAIRMQKKTLTEIAVETGVAVNTVKSRIRKCYQRKAWAERFIAIALENEKEQKEKQQKQQKMAQAEAVDKKNVVTDESKTKKKAMLIDTSMLLNYPEVLQDKKDAKLLVPRFCWHTAMRIVEEEKKTNPSLASKHEAAMSSLDVEEVFIQSLPYIHRVPEKVKSHSVMFLKYLVKLRETHPDIMPLTCSREIKEIASMNGISL